MKRNDVLVMTEDELFAEKLKVCIVSEGLSVDEHKNMLDYLKTLQKEEKIQPLGYRNIRPGNMEQTFSIGFTLHECILRYPSGDEKDTEKRMEIGNSCEFIRLLPADVVFVFVGDKEPLPYKGRLWTRIETLEKPIVYFMRNKDNTSWLPYKCCQFVWDEDSNIVLEDWCFIGSVEEYKPTEEELKEMEDAKNDNRFYRAFSKTTMTDREYEIGMRCLRVNSSCFALELAAMTKRLPELEEKAHKYLEEETKIFINLQRTEVLTEEILKLWESQLDFLEAELDELRYL